MAKRKMESAITTGKTRKLTVTSEFGTFSRTTGREYSHIVIVRGVNIAAYVKARTEQIEKFVAPGPKRDAQLASLAKWSKGAIERNASAGWIAVHWCGRYDLAASAAQRLRSKHDGAEVISLETGERVAA